MKKQKSPAAAAKRPGGDSPERQSREHRDYTSKQDICQEKRRRRTEDQTITKPGYWAVLPASVRYDPALPNFAKVLYAEISSLTDQKGYCFASNAYFQQLFSTSERTLQRTIRMLEKGGYISVVDGDGGQGRRKIYAGINPLCGNPDKNDGVPDNPDKNDGVTPTKMTGSTLYNKKDNNKPPQAPQGGKRPKAIKTEPEWKPERFAGFWNFYPKCAHKSKQAAMRAWDRLRPGDELIAEIGKALRRQMATDEWIREIGIPYPATYLNQRRWEDEIAEPDGSGPAPEQPAAAEGVEWI